MSTTYIFNGFPEGPHRGQRINVASAAGWEEGTTRVFLDNEIAVIEGLNTPDHEYVTRVDEATGNDGEAADTTSDPAPAPTTPARRRQSQSATTTQE